MPDKFRERLVRRSGKSHNPLPDDIDSERIQNFRQFKIVKRAIPMLFEKSEQKRIRHRSLHAEKVSQFRANIRMSGHFSINDRRIERSEPCKIRQDFLWAYVPSLDIFLEDTIQLLCVVRRRFFLRPSRPQLDKVADEMMDIFRNRMFNFQPEIFIQLFLFARVFPHQEIIPHQVRKR